MTSFDRVIIGGGLAGLLAGRRATARGEATVILEANDYFGGAICKAQLAGLVLDSGAEAISTVNPEIFKALTELGIQEQDLARPEPAPAWIVGPTQRFQIPRGYLGIPADLDDPELRSIFTAEEIAEAKRRDSVEFLDHSTVSELITVRLGEAFLNKLIGPVFSGVFGSSPEMLECKSAIPSLISEAKKQQSLVRAVSDLAVKDRPGSNVIGIEGGLVRLIDHLVADLTSKGVLLVGSTSVVEVIRSTEAFEVITDSQSFRSSSITVAGGVGFLRTGALKLLDIESAVSNLPSTLSHVVQVYVRSRQLSHMPLGPGALVQIGSGILAKATTHSNSKWAWLRSALPKDEHLIRLSYDPASANPETFSNQDLASEICKLFEVNDIDILDKKITRWTDVLNQSSNGALTQLRSLATKLESPELEFCGGVFSGSSVAAILLDHQKRKAA